MCATVHVWHHLVKATEITAGMAESNGSLPPGGWLIITCRLTACTPGSAPGPTLGKEYRRTLPLSNRCTVHGFLKTSASLIATAAIRLRSRHHSYVICHHRSTQTTERAVEREEKDKHGHSVAFIHVL